MKEKDQTHWVMQEIAEQEADGSSIDLWPRVEARATLLPDQMRVRTSKLRKERFAVVLVLVMVLVGTLIIVPEARAFTESVFQRMGIAFVNPERLGDTVVDQAQANRVTLPLSLSMDELRQRISFNLLTPAWLPDGLVYVNRGIREYEPAESAGSGQKVSIQYARTADFNPDGGVLRLTANDGPIDSPPLLAAFREQSVTVNGQLGIYVHGSWRDDGGGDPNIKLGSLQWDDNADDAYLTWTQDNVTYLLEAHNLSLGLDEVLHIAGSMR